MRHMWSSFVHQHNECDITCVLEHLMHILHLPGWLFSPRCINLLMQRPEFLTVASLCLVIQGFPSIVVIPYEPGDTSCMNLVTFDSCPTHARCVAVLLQRPDLGLLLSWFWATIMMGLHCELHRVARTLEITFWTTLIIAACCNNLGICSLQPVFSCYAWLFTLGHIHASSSCDRAVVCAGICWP